MFTSELNQGSNAGSRFAKNLGFFDEGGWNNNNNNNNNNNGDNSYSEENTITEKKVEKIKKKVRIINFVSCSNCEYFKRNFTIFFITNMTLFIFPPLVIYYLYI